LVIEGQALKTTFGTEGAEWHWQSGGTVRIENRRVTLALHDLTGFEGRCDAILLTTNETLVPPNHDPELAAFRRKLLGYPETPEPAGEFDFVVRRRHGTRGSATAGALVSGGAGRTVLRWVATTVPVRSGSRARARNHGPHRRRGAGWSSPAAQYTREYGGPV
jgi:hypothetical protein